MEISRRAIAEILTALGIIIIMFIGTYHWGFDNGVKSMGIMPPPIDTTYSVVKLDSISVEMGKHDTTIYKLKIKLKDDIEKSYQLNDSASIELFKQLVADK